MTSNPLWTPINNPYIPWDIDSLYKGIAMLRANLGVAINIGVGIFLIVFSVFLVIKVIRWFVEH